MADRVQLVCVCVCVYMCMCVGCVCVCFWAYTYYLRYVHVRWDQAVCGF